MKRKTIMQAGKELLARKNVRNALLICGILSFLLYVAMNIIGAMQYDGYSSASQTISELSAIGAPSRPLWVWLGFVYNALMLAFALGVLASAGRNRMLRIIGILLLAFVIVGFAWPFASMHQREVLAAGGGTFADTMHLIFGGVNSILFLLIIGFGASAFGKRFRIYSIATIIAILLFGTLMGMDAPKVAANEPTPWVGVTERIMVLGSMLWFAVLAIALLRKGRGKGTPERSGLGA